MQGRTNGNLSLHSPIQFLKGVGPERAALLERLGIKTVLDLLLHRPRRYEDRRAFCQISMLNSGQTAAIRGRVVAMGPLFFPKSQRVAFDVIIEDGSGRLVCRWWNAPYMERYFRVGQWLIAYGTVVGTQPLRMDHPEIEEIDSDVQEASLHVGRLVPIYPTTENLSQRALRRLIWRAFESIGSIPEPYGQELDGQLIRLESALRWLHFPENQEQIELARKRLAFEEILPLQWEMQRRRLKLLRHARSVVCRDEAGLVEKFLAKLSFKLTVAQQRVIGEIREDMGKAIPMRRLLQGDVGSGKTVVASCAALMALGAGFDVLMMVPTEVLAFQHYIRFHSWYRGLGVEVRLCVSGTGLGEPSLDAQAGPVMWIGTHALLYRQFNPDRIGLVIIDEQHKFGVVQRQGLLRKGRHPHLLMLTATPIPRTLALTIYGDLEISLLDEQPGGRGPLQTYVRHCSSLPKIWQFVRSQLDKGRQAYVIYARLTEEESELELKAAEREFDTLSKMMAPHRVELLHGRLSPAQKLRVLRAFEEGKIRLLVSTSVVEVGLDVPNASVMVIENAERFGLGQLHQLRGRIARSPYPAFCILVTSSTNPEVLARLRDVARTHNGFEVAELDLRYRGPGELLGRAQSGFPRFRFFQLEKDVELAALARQKARMWLEKGPLAENVKPFLLCR